jgi:predicted nucleotidyltransferase
MTLLDKQSDPANDPVMHRFRAALDSLYGERLERAVLFGSRARGDAHADSDYDVALFRRDYRSLWEELQPLGEITTAILLDTDAVISPKLFPEGTYRNRSLLMGEIRREGIDL